MGNCVGHSGQKADIKNLHNAKNEEDTEYINETQLSHKSQEANKEKMSPGMTTLKGDSGAHKSERQNRNSFKGTGRVPEPTEDWKDLTTNAPVAHQTKDQGTLQADTIDENLETNNKENRESRQKRITGNTTTTTDSSPKQQDSLTTDTIEPNRRNSTQGQNLTACESEIPKYCDKNDDESTKECLGSNKEMIGEKSSRFLEHTGGKKCSLDNVHIADNMERSSTVSTKSVIESEENAESFEKLVLRACFSENVRKAFVALSADFINPRQDVNNTDIGTKVTDEGETLQERSITFTEGCPENKETDEIGNSEGFIEPREDVGSERTDKELPLREKLSTFTECYRENVEIDLNRESTDLIDPQENVGKFFVADVNTTVEVKDDNSNCHELNKESNPTQRLSENERKDQNGQSKTFVNAAEGDKISSTESNHLDPVKNVTEDGQAINQEPLFTGCFPENKETKFDCNNAHIGKNIEGTKLENGLDEADAARKHSTDSINVEGGVECLSNTIDNEIDVLQDLSDKEQLLNEISIFTEICSVREETSSANENEFDIVQNTQQDETALNENYIFTGRCLETEEADFLKHSIDSTELENNLVCSSTKDENELTPDRDVQEKGQPLSEDSEFHESCSTERDDTRISKDSTYFSESEYNLVRSSSAHELDMGQAISDKGQSFKEESAFTDYCPTEEETDLSMESTDRNLVRSPTMDRAIPDKDDHLDDDSTFTDCCPDNQVDVGFSEHSTCFKGLVENMLSSFITNQDELDIDEDTRDKGPVLNEESVSEECFSEMENIDFDKEGKDTVDLEVNSPKTSITNEDSLDMDKHVPDTRLPLSNDSGFTECYLEREETRCGEHSTTAIDFRESSLIPSSTDETDLNMNKNVPDESEPSDEDSMFIQCFTPEYDGAAMVSHEDRTNDDKFVADQEDETSETVNECLFDANSPFTECYSGNEMTEVQGTNEYMNDDDMYEILNFDPESGFVKGSTLYVSSSTRNENELSGGKEVLDNEKTLNEESTFPGNCSKNQNIEIQETNEECERFIHMNECFNIEQENETINECPFDIFKESILYDTGSFNTDKENDDSLPDRCVGSVLYEIVSLPTRNVDEDCHNNGLSLNKDSAFPGCCSEEDRGTGSSSNLERKLSKGTESVDKSLFRKSDHCMSDFCEDSALYETLSYCKIDREASCDCFEQVDKDCCCQCCECIGNHD